MAPSEDGRDLHAVVDMGSNGIRFSITDLDPSIARTLIPVYHHRSPISLHNAQYVAISRERQAVPATTIEAVTSTLQSFKETCASYGVPEKNVTVVATEATRTAPNATELLSAIKTGTDWDVQLLSKEEEARLGALGVAASVPLCQGLVMDLGGGSIQLSWVKAHEDGGLAEVSEEVASLPYGAAALMRRLAGESEHDILQEVQAELGKAANNMNSLDRLVQKLPSLGGGSASKLPLYLSGGGFRGWGYLSMASGLNRTHPIQAINGYTIPWSSFINASGLLDFVSATQDTNKASRKPKKGKEQQSGTGIHGVSARRLAQLPAITLIVKALAHTLPALNIRIGSVTFCAGGVPVGLLYSRLGDTPRTQSALAIAASMSSLGLRSHPQHSSGRLRGILGAALSTDNRRAPGSPPQIIKSIVPALAHLTYIHAPLDKGEQASSALHYPLTGSVPIAAALGISHAERIALALALCSRWGGVEKLPKEQVELAVRLRDDVGAVVSWWAEVLGRICTVLLLGGFEDVTTNVIQNHRKGRWEWEWKLRASASTRSRDSTQTQERSDREGGASSDESSDDDTDDVGRQPAATSEETQKAIKSLQKIGKKKNHVTTAAVSSPLYEDLLKASKGGARETFGMRVVVSVV